MDCYIDINGVLLTHDLKPAEGVVDFLRQVTEKYTCFWLTTHCKGDRNTCVNYLRPILPSQAMWYVEKILPTDWQTLKTEAIKWDRPFVWFDDVLFEAEERELQRHKSFDSFIRVDLNKNPNALELLLVS